MTTTPDQTSRGPTAGTPGATSGATPGGATGATGTTGTKADVAAPPAPVVAPEDALQAAKAPVGTGASPLFAQLVALGLVCLGVVGVQALLVTLDLATGPSWIDAVVDAADGVAGRSVPVLVGGVVAVVLGVLLLPVVVRRRPRKGLALRASTGVHLRRRDLARVITSSLEGTTSVTDCSVKAKRRTVRVVATSVANPDQNAVIESEIGTRADAVLSSLERAPRLRVTVRNDGM
ncbi:hypothetical protein EUA93_09550 [Nocardioides oleivorans]|uniref:Alkaline shock response membrane anchor protein AmaP n=1 Tax=Nocardioides oleivorans TaxID=273676 RepID=A0A4Q2S2H3_9ACTN|nr:hypothetical protein [Nocardioides oleivorans]RYB94564.1 hypothetical protein EUA93_09550 [Nocardioides oleivorans]